MGVAFIKTESAGWVRADIIVNVYVDGDKVKLRTTPGVFTWHPVYSTHETPEGAESAAEELIKILLMQVRT